MDVLWSSSDKNIAMIFEENETGAMVTGVTEGAITIIATSKLDTNVKGTFELKVVSVIPDEDYVYCDIMELKKEFPEGMTWTNDNYYEWNGGIFSGGYGCAGFAFRLSDAAFGTLPAYQHTDFSNIRVGDILRIDNNSHSVIVLEVNEDNVVIAEGNYNNSVY